MDFKRDKTLEERSNLYKRLTSIYLDRIPVIVERHEGCNIEEIDNRKFLVPDNTTISTFIYVLRKRLHLTPERALYLFHNNTLYTGSTLISQIPQDEDGFRYLKYAGENTFGCPKLNDILSRE